LSAERPGAPVPRGVLSFSTAEARAAATARSATPGAVRAARAQRRAQGTRRARRSSVGRLARSRVLPKKCRCDGALLRACCAARRYNANAGSLFRTSVRSVAASSTAMVSVPRQPAARFSQLAPHAEIALPRPGNAGAALRAWAQPGAPLPLYQRAMLLGAAFIHAAFSRRKVHSSSYAGYSQMLFQVRRPRLSRASFAVLCFRRRESRAIRDGSYAARKPECNPPAAPFRQLMSDVPAAEFQPLRGNEHQVIATSMVTAKIRARQRTRKSRSKGDTQRRRRLVEGRE